MKIAFIHSDKKIITGAHYINELICQNLKKRGVLVKNFYPKVPLIENSPMSLRGLANILFFYSMLEHRKGILKYNLIQGTTYTPLSFLSSPIPVISHFGSVTDSFIKSVPLANDMESETKEIWYELRRQKVIDEVNVATRRPLRDIAEVEKYVAANVSYIIATSQNVKNELVGLGINPDKIRVFYNAIEDYWYAQKSSSFAPKPHLVFLGRIGKDAFTLKMKGLDRLLHFYQRFANVPKISICMTTNKKLIHWFLNNICMHQLYTNLRKDLIPKVLAPLKGSILFIPSRYEGFSLSLIEGMSQGLVPIAYPVGVASEIIKDGYNGFIVHNQRQAILTAEKLLKDTKLRHRLAHAAQNSAARFQSELLTDRLVDFYSDIISIDR